jgi:hypothetical protein
LISCCSFSKEAEFPEAMCSLFVWASTEEIFFPASFSGIFTSPPYSLSTRGRFVKRFPENCRLLRLLEANLPILLFKISSNIKRPSISFC